MYNTHCPVIAHAMTNETETFKRGLYFVICSIRQSIVNVPEQVEAVERYGAGAECVWGSKRPAVLYIDKHYKQLHADVLACRKLRDKMLTLLTVPGLGIVKSAFALQLMGHNVACLDSRNVAREGRNPRAFRTDGRSPSSLAPKVDAYLNETRGKARFYWDTWCEDAGRAHKRTAEEISALHLAILQPAQFELEDTF